MANIYTKTGDSGSTSLYGGSRVLKSSLRVECYGTIDELTSSLGVAVTQKCDLRLEEQIKVIQNKLFVLGAELASDEKGIGKLKEVISDSDVNYLEKIVDYCTKITGLQTEFVRPGVNPCSACLHHARTIARRAERRVIQLSQNEIIRPIVLKYINRLSDAIYAMARIEEFTHNVELTVKRSLQELENNNKVRKLDLATAKTLVGFAEEKAKEIGVPMIISIVDKGGNIITFSKMDEAILASIDISINKAYTAVSIKLPTHKLTPLCQPGESLYGLQNTNENRIVIFGGGYPLMINDILVGGIGVSGGTVEQDMAVAEYAINKVNGVNEYDK